MLTMFHRVEPRPFKKASHSTYWRLIARLTSSVHRSIEVTVDELAPPSFLKYISWHRRRHERSWRCWNAINVCEDGNLTSINIIMYHIAERQGRSRESSATLNVQMNQWRIYQTQVHLQLFAYRRLWFKSLLYRPQQMKRINTYVCKCSVLTLNRIYADQNNKLGRICKKHYFLRKVMKSDALQKMELKCLKSRRRKHGKFGMIFLANNSRTN